MVRKPEGTYMSEKSANRRLGADGMSWAQETIRRFLDNFLFADCLRAIARRFGW